MSFSGIQMIPKRKKKSTWHFWENPIIRFLPKKLCQKVKAKLLNKVPHCAIEYTKTSNFCFLYTQLENNSGVIIWICTLTSSGMGKNTDFIVKIRMNYINKFSPIPNAVREHIKKTSTLSSWFRYGEDEKSFGR